MTESGLQPVRFLPMNMPPHAPRMADYPVNLRLRSRRCVVVGGGAVAVRKIGALLDADADVVVFAPDVRPEIDAWESARRIRVERIAYEPGQLEGAFLAIAATNRGDVNRAVARDAGGRGILVNVADDPAACDFTLPAVARGREWSIAISTGGASPALARRLREMLVSEWGASIDALLAWLGEARRERTAAGATSGARAETWRRVVDAGVLEALRDGDEATARLLFDAALRGARES